MFDRKQRNIRSIPEFDIYANITENIQLGFEAAGLNILPKIKKIEF